LGTTRADLIMAWLQPQPTRERPDTFRQTALGNCSRPLHGRGEPYISLDDVLQHLLVERQIRHDPLQAPVLLLELAQPLHLTRHQAGVFLIPIEIGRLADARLPADLLDRRAILTLPDDECLSARP